MLLPQPWQASGACGAGHGAALLGAERCFGWKRGARKVNPSQPSQGSHPQADTDKLKITGLC